MPAALPLLLLSGALVAGPAQPEPPPQGTPVPAVVVVGLAAVGVGALAGAAGLVGATLHAQDSQRLVAAANAASGDRARIDELAALRDELGSSTSRASLATNYLVLVVGGAVVGAAGWLMTAVGGLGLGDDDP